LTTVILEAQRARAKQILEILRESLSILEEDFATLVVWRESSDPFRVLVVTILSQNCTDIAALRAYRTLEQEVGVTPLKLSRTKISQITKAIHAAGLHRQKARALKRLAQIIADRYSSTINNILHEPVDEARTLLQQLPKVGPKTADVLLSVWGQPTISVDTHVNRVSKRLGLAPQKANYEETRTALMQLYRAEDYRLIPLLFMAHGRSTCKALRPRCPSCLVERLCPYTKKTMQSQ
jgi:endonuclease-3